MADSKLLKEAIADAKAVRETAIENARIALEEAFTPKLQSLVSKKLQAEMEGEDDEDDFDYDDVEENVNSSGIGKGDGKSDSGTDNKQPSGNTAHTELDPETQSQSAAVGHEDSENEKVDDLKETESAHELPDPYDAEYETPEEEGEVGVYEEEGFEDEDEFDEDELDLESIIRELEAEISEDEDEEDADDVESEPFVSEEDEEFDFEDDDEVEIELPESEEAEYDDEIDLDEILREMGYGDDEDEHYEEAAEVDNSKIEDLEGELEEAYTAIRDLKGTINEVNLLNAKLLYTNKLFRSYELDNSQKVKVVESLDRTSNVREVKLVYSTLAESLKFGGNVGSKKVKKITEGLASRPSKSTAPTKEIIQEGNEMADRFKKLAGINKQ